jgi:hypothetical protein
VNVAKNEKSHPGYPKRVTEYKGTYAPMHDGIACGC